MNRKPVSLDYDFGSMSKKVSAGYSSEFGPGTSPTRPKEKLIKCIIAPFYDYDKSSPALAWAYKEIAESAIPDAYVIIGRCESGFNTYLFGDWDTPFASMKINVELGKALIKKFPMLRNDARPFVEDITIERQLPCLQFAKRDSLDRVKFLPILIGDVNHDKLLEFAKVLGSIGSKISVICSCNLTRYGRGFGYVPFVHGVKENLYNLDNNLIDHIVKLDSEAFYANAKQIPEKNVFVLGMEIVKSMGGTRGSLLNYYTSGDLDDNYNRSVGLGAIVFR